MQANKKITAFLLSLFMLISIVLQAHAAPNDINVKDKSVNTAISNEYKKIAENEEIELYLKETNAAIKIRDKKLNYVWSSVIDDLVPGENNGEWSNFMQSGIAIDYLATQSTKESRMDLLSLKSKSISMNPIKDGFDASIAFNDIKISFDMQVRIKGRDLVVTIPNKSIKEEENFKISAIYIYPFLGATKRDEISGYMFIPDGSGALIYLQDNQNKYKVPYQAKIYGDNLAIDDAKKSGVKEEDKKQSISKVENTAKPPYSIKLPVFGMIHGENEKGLLGIVEKGKYNAQILAYPNGVNTQYNWVTTRFILRELYLQPTSRTMGGVITYEKDRNTEDMQVKYEFLREKEASYLGMAKNYQRYLIDKGVLSENKNKIANIPVRLDLLGAESEKGLILNKVIPMTTVKQAKEIVEELRDKGVQELSLVYKGWNKGGLSGRSPVEVKYDPKIGSKKDFEELQQYLLNFNIPLYFYDDYTIAYDESSRFSAKSDAAKRINKKLIEIENNKPVYKKYYYMSPEKAEKIAEDNASRYEKNSIENVAIDNTSNKLFSELKGNATITREENVAKYENIMKNLSEKLKATPMYSPNEYMLKYADGYFDIPMTSSEYVFISETVPFIEIVLRGYMDYYAPYSNFASNQLEDTLRSIEYGAYPSYYLTYESTYKLKHTNSNDVYTSTYADWKEAIVEQYKLMSEALSKVINAKIVERTSLSEGVVKVSYSNNIAIIVNYNDYSYNAQGIVVPNKGFKVIEVK